MGGDRIPSVGYAARALVADAPNPPLSGQSLTVQEDYGPVFAGRIPFTALIWPQHETPVEGVNAEYAQVIGISGDVLSLIRGSQPIEIEEGMQVAAMDVVPVYERGTEVTLVGHFLEDDPPYTVHIRKPSGETESIGTAGGVTDDNDGNSYYAFTPDLSGLWTYRWQSDSGHLDDNSFFVDYSDVLP